MQETINQFISSYMKLCKAAHAYAPLMGNAAAAKPARQAAENAYFDSLQACEALAHQAFPGVAGITPVLTKTLSEAAASTAPLEKFKTESLARVMAEIAALPGRNVMSVKRAMALDGVDGRKR